MSLKPGVSTASGTGSTPGSALPWSPTSPITLNVLGVDQEGTPVAGATPSAEDLNEPGFADTWTDVETLKGNSAPMATSLPSDSRPASEVGSEDRGSRS